MPPLKRASSSLVPLSSSGLMLRHAYSTTLRGRSKIRKMLVFYLAFLSTDIGATSRTWVFGVSQSFEAPFAVRCEPRRRHARCQNGYGYGHCLIGTTCGRCVRCMTRVISRTKPYSNRAVYVTTRRVRSMVGRGRTTRTRTDAGGPRTDKWMDAGSFARAMEHSQSTKHLQVTRWSCLRNFAPSTLSSLLLLYNEKTTGSEFAFRTKALGLSLAQV